MCVVNCMNLCELMSYFGKRKENFKEFFEEAKQKAGYKTCERIYIGTSFCGKNFLYLNKEAIAMLAEFCKKEKMHLTLTVPVFSEGDLIEGKKKIREIYENNRDVVDEITVNDYGMAVYIRENYNLRMNLGRMLMKDYRDPRYEKYFCQSWRPKVFTDFLKNFLLKYKITGMEFDPTHEMVDFEELPQGIELGIHVPYCYMTVGRICEYASIHKAIDKKFRPNDQCMEECQDTVICYEEETDRRKFIQVGRAVFFENGKCQVKGVHAYRNIFFPVDLEVQE